MSSPGAVSPLRTPTDALDRALARADAYRVLATAFRDPDDPGAEDALDLRALRSAVGELGAEPPPEAWPALRCIARHASRAPEHRAIFGHVVASGCPPYETEFGRRHVFGQSQELGDIRGFYEAFGVRPRKGGERPDHLACQLEFLALLALKEATALATGEDERLGVCRDAAARFLADHLGRWLPALAGRIAGRAPDSGYTATATVAAALVADHARELGAVPVALDPDDLVPITDTPDGFSFECGVDVEGGDLAPPGS
ncbi:MAG: molecular chaperone TorD family protein [Candidatus Limnocylindrales bacterium]|nr:molecular chaperone TorD family protein [Candidatus Limnocylindrales bacterium]